MSTITTLGPVGFNPTGAYDPTREYEKLDVVIYQGSSYVAKTDSIGQLPSDNSEYWLRLAAGGLGHDDIVDNLTSTASDKALSAKQGKTLNDKITSVEENIKDQMVVIGDSYSSRTYLVSPNKLWCEILAENLGLTLHNFADPGAGFIHVGDERHGKFIDEINEAYNDTSFDNDKVKYLFIYGGTNDLRYSSAGKTELIQAYVDTMFLAREKFPNSKIIYLGCTLIWSFYPVLKGDGETITELWVDNTIKQNNSFKTNNLISIDMTMFYLGMDAYFTSGVAGHPNARGHIDLADAILNGLNSSSNSFCHTVSVTPTVASSSSAYVTLGNTFSGINKFILRITDKDLKLYLATNMSMSQRRDSYIIKTPFNLIIPYASPNNIQSPRFDFANIIIYGATHDMSGIVGQTNTLLENSYGKAELTIYPNFVDTTNNNYDIYYSNTLNY